mmetsp:Transcript_36456/g.67355  ORF Transcript_36456/g.67355 Transcript_36456/m.67355 type:complete len:179 (+) Transcript_36456:143-679(+)
MISRKCFPETPNTEVEVYFSSYDAIDRADQEALRSGKKGYRVNRNPSKHKTIAFDPNASRRFSAHESPLTSRSGPRIILTFEHSEIARNPGAGELPEPRSAAAQGLNPRGATDAKRKTNLERPTTGSSPNLTDLGPSSELSSVLDLPSRIGDLRGTSVEAAAAFDAFEDFVAISESHR